MVGMERGVSRCVSVTMEAGVTPPMVSARVPRAGEVNTARSEPAATLSHMVRAVVSPAGVTPTTLRCEYHDQHHSTTDHCYLRCHPWTGECQCRPGYSGAHCHRPCPLYTWGRRCDHVCSCENSATCSPVDGSCSCAPGWRGPRCDSPCVQGRYGEQCRYECKCANGGVCDHVSGKCECKPGEDFICIVVESS